MREGRELGAGRDRGDVLGPRRGALRAQQHRGVERGAPCAQAFQLRGDDCGGEVVSDERYAGAVAVRAAFRFHEHVHAVGGDAHCAVALSSFRDLAAAVWIVVAARSG